LADLRRLLNAPFWAASQPQAFFRVNANFRFAHATQPGVQWLLRRNCSVTPAQLLTLYASLCGVSVLIASYFWAHGARMVSLFAALELTAVGAAFLVYARHAVDRERIALSGAQLVVELEKGGRVERCEFDRSYVRVEPMADDRSLIELSGQGRTVQIGRFLRPEQRPLLAKEIRAALRLA
jgi:uncharacterized membrane protein